MSTLPINLINLYKGDLGLDLQELALALAKQANADFIPVWAQYLHWDQVAVTVEPQLQPGAVPLYVQNTSDQAGAEAYHDDQKGIEGRVFLDTIKAAGDDLTSPFSHELLELLLDPYVNLTYTVNGTMFSGEDCDMTQEDTYEVNGLKMSNFAFPGWFKLPGACFDHMGLMTYPGEIRPGGYMSEKRGRRWVTVFGSPAAATRFNHAAHHRINKRHGRHAP